MTGDSDQHLASVESNMLMFLPPLSDPCTMDTGSTLRWFGTDRGHIDRMPDGSGSEEASRRISMWVVLRRATKGLHIEGLRRSK